MMLRELSLSPFPDLTFLSAGFILWLKDATDSASLAFPYSSQTVSNPLFFSVPCEAVCSPQGQTPCPGGERSDWPA